MEENKNKNCQHYKTTFCWKYFHKRHRDLTPEEKKKFLRIRKNISRQNRTEEQKQKEIEYVKNYNIKNKEKIRERQKRYNELHPNRVDIPYKNSVSYKYFGKRRKDLNKEEMKIYINLIKKGYYKTEEEKEKIKEKQKLWRINNIDKIRKWNKNYVSAHQEELKEKRKKYAEEHKEEISNRQKEYYIKNKDKINAKHREMYHKNIEHYRKKQREKYQKHIEYYREYNRKKYQKRKLKLQEEASLCQ